MRGQDHFWAVEDGLLSMLSGTGAETRVAEMLFAALPSEDHNISPSESARRIRSFISGAGFIFCPAHLQSHAKIILSHVTAVEAGTAADEVNISAAVKLVQQAWARCSFFLRYGPDNEKKYGTTGMHHLLLRLTECKADKKLVTSDEYKDGLRLLARYRWLVSADDEAMAVDLQQEEDGEPAAKKAKKGKVRPAAGGGAASSSSGAASSKELKEQADRDVEACFS